MAERDGFIYMNAKGEFAVITNPMDLANSHNVNVNFVADINQASILKAPLRVTADKLKHCLKLPVVEKRTVEILIGEA